MKILLTLIFFVVACAPRIPPVQIATENRVNLLRLSPGMTKDQMFEIMGIKKYNENSMATTVTNPHRNEAYTTSDGTLLEAIFYYTNVTMYDNVITDDELTPLILIDGTLVGWGWNFYRDTTRKYDIDIEIKGETPLIISLHPESEIPPTIRTSVNKNVNILRDCHRIAIVGITRHSIPTLETMLNEYKDARTKGTLDMELEHIAARATLDSAVYSAAYPYFQEMNVAAEKAQDSLWGAHMQTLINDHAANELHFKRITYEAYESNFLKCGFDMIERDRIDAVLQELNLSELGLIDDKSAITAGKMLAAQAVCLIENYSTDGEYFEPPNPKASFYRETFKVIIVETGQIALTGMNQNLVNGTELMFYGLATRILAQYPPLIE